MWEIAGYGIVVVLLIVAQLAAIFCLAQLSLYFHGEVKAFVDDKRDRRRRRPHEMIPRRDLRLPR